MSASCQRTRPARFTTGPRKPWVNRIPYAYVIGPNGPLILGDPAKVEAIRFMFETYATTSVSLRELARKLERRGAPPPKGGWTRDVVGCWLHNQAYVGTFRWNAEHTGRHCRVKGGQVTEI